MSDLVSVVIPTRNRPEQAQACVDRCRHVSRGYDVEIIVVTEDMATVRAMAGTSARVCRSETPLTAPQAWHLGAKIAKGDVLVLGADDLWFFHGWVGETLDCMAAFPDGAGVVGFNDLARDGNDLATHWAVHRRFAVEHLGGSLYPPCYRHYFGDNEVNARAKRWERFVWARYAIVEHRHPIFGKANVDSLYLEKQAWFEDDRALFEARAKVNFPNVWQPALAAQ
jgi:glycosyltransferase involved in cell wall biosynthesis